MELLLCVSSYYTGEVYIVQPRQISGASQSGTVVKNLPAMQERRVQSLGQEDPLEKEMETCSSILAWEIPWIGAPGGLQTMGWQKSCT